jgi:hypothetical protein
MWRRVAFVRTDVIGELSALSGTLMMEVIFSSETSVLARTTRRHITVDDFLAAVETSNLIYCMT